MNKRILFIGGILLALSCSKNGGGEGDPASVDAEDVLLHRYDDYMQAPVVKNSHAEETGGSCLQPIWSCRTVIPHAILTAAAPASVSVEQKTAVYPRIKKVADGTYLMFYHGGEFGSRVYLTRSNDLVEWSEPVMLYSPYAVTIDGAEDIRRFVNMDAVVLADGEILAVCSYREEKNYAKGIGGGLMLIRSKDNGKTWSQPRTIYEGTNWEPYLLELPDGRIQCYFTDATPQTRNSGTSVIVSEDKGATWSEKIRCCRLYKYLYDGDNTEYTGQKIFTDQMPCFRILNDGKTLLGFLEGRLETPASIKGSSYCKMSLVWNEGFEWKDLGEESAGPQKRLSSVVRGAAGYIEVFPSGEVVLSCGRSSLFSMKIVDSEGGYNSTENWDSRWYTPFEEKGYWGCMERTSPHTLAAAMHGNSGMQIGLFWLNHRIDAAKSTVTCDGNPSEWDNEDLLFLSTPDGAEVIIRASRDEQYLYLLSEFVCPSGTDPRLDLKLLKKNGNGTCSMTLSSSSSAPVSVRRGKTRMQQSGFAAEAAIPLKELGSPVDGDRIPLFATLSSSGKQETFTLSDISKPNTWQTILLR